MSPWVALQEGMDTEISECQMDARAWLLVLWLEIGSPQLGKLFLFNCGVMKHTYEMQ